MSKIPVRATISESYRTVREQYVSLLGILWLPTSLYLLLNYVLMRGLFDQIVLDLTKSVRGMPATEITQLIHLAFNSLISAAIVRQVYGLIGKPTLVYFRFGVDELRTFASLVLTVIFAYGMFIVATIAGGLIVAFSLVPDGDMSAGGQVGGKFLVTLFEWLAVVVAIAAIPAIYLGIRLGFFMVPVAVREKRLGLFRSWELTRGNVFRCLVIVIAVWLPGILVGLVTIYFEYRNGWWQILAAMLKDPRTSALLGARLMRSAMAMTPYLLPVGVLLAPLTIALPMLPGPIAYRRLGLDGLSSGAVQEADVSTNTAPA